MALKIAAPTCWVVMLLLYATAPRNDCVVCWKSKKPLLISKLSPSTMAAPPPLGGVILIWFVTVLPKICKLLPSTFDATKMPLVAGLLVGANTRSIAVAIAVATWAAVMPLLITIFDP